MSETMTFSEVCEAAKIRWERAHRLAAKRIEGENVDPCGIVFRNTVSVIYGEGEDEDFEGAIEENDYFLQKYDPENPSLPARIKSLYGLEVDLLEHES